MILRGRVWKFGDELGATDLVSAAYDRFGMSRQWDECAKHLLEDIDPHFPAKVGRGDLLVAGRNLGAGHAHYYTAAIMGAHTAGIGGMLGETMGGLFRRAAIDLGVPALAVGGIAALVETGDELEVDLAAGKAVNRSNGAKIGFAAVSPIVLDILAAGGSTSWALDRIGYREPAPAID